MYGLFCKIYEKIVEVPWIASVYTAFTEA